MLTFEETKVGGKERELNYSAFFLASSHQLLFPFSQIPSLSNPKALFQFPVHSGSLCQFISFTIPPSRNCDPEPLDVTPLQFHPLSLLPV